MNTEPYQAERQYFTFDIIDIMAYTDTLSQDSEFDILSQDSQQQQPMDSQSPQTQGENKSGEQPRDSLTQDSTSSQQTEYDYALPIQANNTVDIDYLKLVWKTFNPGTSCFTAWCSGHHIQKQMDKKKLTFGENEHFKQIKNMNRTIAMQQYNAWAATFHMHKSTFDSWMQNSTTTPPMPTGIYSWYDTNINLLEYHLKAYDIVEKSPRKERVQMHEQRKLWAYTLMSNHNLTFTEWLKTAQNYTFQPPSMVQYPDLDTATLVDIQPYENLFQYAVFQANKSKQDLTQFILDVNTKQIYQSENMDITPDLFYPGALFARTYIPNYAYIPSAVCYHLKLRNNLEELPHLQQILWLRLKEAQREAYETEPQRWADYFEEHMPQHLTPFVQRFLQQKPQDRPFISSIHIMQHLQAHAYCKEKGGPSHIERTDFYDMFIRPLEFLCGQGMPLNSCLTASITNYASRCNMFKILLELAGFGIMDGSPIQQHYAYSELTRIRHISGLLLIPQLTPQPAPYQRLDSMPRITYQNKTKPISPINPQELDRHGKFANVMPHPFCPLPDSTLDQFPRLGGRNMALCDEYSLHTQFLRAYKQLQTGRPNYNLRPDSRSSTPEFEAVPPSHTPKLTPQIGQDADAHKTWIALVEESDKPQPQKQVTNPQKAATEQKNDGTTISLSLAQLRELVTPQQSTTTAMAPTTTPKQPATDNSQLWEFSQTQSQMETTFFEKDKLAEAARKAAVSKSADNLPKASYHPTIHPRPSWDDPSRVPEDKKIFDTQLIWACNDHYNIPLWAKSSHSAISLFNTVDGQAPMTEQTKARYREMPHFRQFPADGLNNINDISIFFQASHSQENIHIKVNSQPYKQLPKRTSMTGMPTTQEIQIPAFTLARFIIFFQDVANTRLKPAMSDVQEEGYQIYGKEVTLNNRQIHFRVHITQGPNGLERTLEIRLKPQPETGRVTAVTIPWIRMAQILSKLQEVHKDLQQTSFI